jgi:hypothetical protein
MMFEILRLGKHTGASTQPLDCALQSVIKRAGFFFNSPLVSLVT